MLAIAHVEAAPTVVQSAPAPARTPARPPARTPARPPARAQGVQSTQSVQSAQGVQRLPLRPAPRPVLYYRPVTYYAPYYAYPAYPAYPAYAAPVRPEAPAGPPGSYAARPGIQIGARVAYSAGFGNVYQGLGMSDWNSGAVPVILDLGWRFLPQLYVGAYGQVAPNVTRTSALACPPGTDCSALDWRVGLEADLHFWPSSRLDPYVGVGGGYEVLHRTVSGPLAVPVGTQTKAGMVDAAITDRGWEMLNVTAGFDLRMARNFGLGPFVTGTLARFDVHNGTESTVLDGGTVSSGSVRGVVHTTHELVIVGVRGTFTR